MICKHKTFIIAEAGVNHNGDADMAFHLVDAAVQAGANAVKFQTFKTENIVVKGADKAAYQKNTTNVNESQFDMLKRLELDQDTHHKLMSYCRKKGIEFLSTAFDLESLDFLVNDLGLTTLKIPSGEITNGPLLLAHAQTGCSLILSTGMSTMIEIEEALEVLAFGLINNSHSKIKPSKSAFQSAYSSNKGRKALKEKVIVLHCTTEYPAPLEDINLNAMITIRDSFDLNIGYSDHSEGIIVPIVAVAMGASLIEKHFTLDKELPGPDHKASLSPGELTTMVNSIRSVESVMGDGIKEPKPSELKNRPIARKCLVAAKSMKVGEKWSEDNLTCKRPAVGISPMRFWEYIDCTVNRNIKVDETITLEDLS